MLSLARIARLCKTSPLAHLGRGGGAPGKGTPVIGKNVFLGAGCVVIGDISIGDGSVIGANAVVTKSIPPNSVAVGVPARVIKTLTS